MSDHHHHHETENIGVAFALNFSFTIIELVGAWATNSTAIAADAIHDLGDSVALAMGYFMARASTTEGTPSFTYGYRRLSLLSALFSGLVLLVGSAVVLVETVPRLWAPEQPDSVGMLALAVLGIAVNGAAAYRVSTGESLNEKMVKWHLLEDVAGWVAVFIVSVVMQFVNAPLLDPLLAVAISLWVCWNTVGHFQQSIRLFLQGAPSSINLDEIRSAVTSLEGALSLDHLHLWSQDGEKHVLTGELCVEEMALSAAINLQKRAQAELQDLGIQHCTLSLTLSKNPTPKGCVSNSATDLHNQAPQDAHTAHHPQEPPQAHSHHH